MQARRDSLAIGRVGTDRGARAHEYCLRRANGRRSAPPHNEDAFLATTSWACTSCADGVGGNAKGEVASAESVELVHSWVGAGAATLEAHMADAHRGEQNIVRRLLESAVQSACYMVFGMGELDPRQKGMSSTLSSLLCVGRRRVHRPGGRQPGLPGCAAGECVQLTEDHTLVNFQLKLGLITAEEAAQRRART